jgi:hypothetical protein
MAGTTLSALAARPAMTQEKSPARHADERSAAQAALAEAGKLARIVVREAAVERADPETGLEMAAAVRRASAPAWAGGQYRGRMVRERAQRQRHAMGRAILGAMSMDIGGPSRDSHDEDTETQEELREPRHARIRARMVVRVKGFRSPDERSDIRVEASVVVPGFRSAHPGYGDHSAAMVDTSIKKFSCTSRSMINSVLGG